MKIIEMPLEHIGKSLWISIMTVKPQLPVKWEKIREWAEGFLDGYPLFGAYLDKNLFPSNETFAEFSFSTSQPRTLVWQPNISFFNAAAKVKFRPIDYSFCQGEVYDGNDTVRGVIKKFRAREVYIYNRHSFAWWSGGCWGNYGSDDDFYIMFSNQAFVI